MASINELYASVYEKLKAIQTQYENAENQLRASQDQDETAKQKRIENLQSQLKKIDEYEEKVNYFRQMAEKHMVSKNLLTITPRELNFNRLRNWAMMIDPTEADDPYAKRIYVQAKCNEMFLSQKRAEFEHTLAALTQDHGNVDEELAKTVATRKAQLVEECRGVIESEEFTQLAAIVAERHGRNQCSPALQAVLESEQTGDEKIGLGVYAQAFPVLNEMKYAAKAKLGEYFDNRGYILLPVEHALDREMIISVNCAAAKEKKLYRGIQNYLLSLISSTAIGTRKIYFLDALHYNNTALGFLRPLEDSIALDAIPKDAEAIVDKLREIVSSFSDIDDALGMADSVRDYNANVAPRDRLGRTILVLVGYPSAFSGEAKDYIKRILLNYDHYGISPVIIDTQFVEKKDDRYKDIPVDIVENIYRIQMTQHREIISQNNGADHYFKWYELTEELSAAFIKDVRRHDTRANSLGTEYIKRVDMESFTPYERGKKSIVLPYGIDSKDDMHSISFDNENFAAYLMGASGSGKSTLLHTLITGILRNYHPDDVELWLADFKMSEFAQYIDPLPPHVKYILL
ncbi:MAG: FtsK/SpoIIIE domain-containing protein, partial [Candidatus Spyradocola sp.]